ncbi:hypothetical protein B0J17DRAFT_719257 [Rhizoctonia solani]|nr:hypothetical protein B0J17DRAFT_719257 [Rhizoctonia solani]
MAVVSRAADFHYTLSVNKIELWESVLRAAVALQMHGIRELILTKLGEDVPNIMSSVAKILRLSLDYEESPRSFPVMCLRILAYRRQRLTPNEIDLLGGKGTCLVNPARERVREALCVLLVKTLRQQQTKDWVSGANDDHSERMMGTLLKILENLPERCLQKTTDTDDIFHDISDQTLCDPCAPARKIVIQTLKDSLHQIMDRTVEQVLSIPNVKMIPKPSELLMLRPFLFVGQTQTVIP